jgi:sulfatase modifying factor 1
MSVASAKLCKEAFRMFRIAAVCALTIGTLTAGMGTSYALESTTVSIREVLIPAGKYYVGNKFGKADYEKIADIEIRDFYIMNTEVTNEFYNMVFHWAQQHQYNLEEPCETCQAKTPVAGISWRGAVVWANALSEMRGLEPAYKSKEDSIVRDFGEKREVEQAILSPGTAGYRLPDIPEWQIAARGAHAALVNGTYGTLHSGSDSIAAVAWDERKAKGGGPSVVARFKPNAAGLYDMSGNVSEWTSAASNLAGTKYYYFCGESWRNSESIDLGFCDMHSSGLSDEDIGFRLVRWKK